MADEKKVLLRLEDVKMHFPIKKDNVFQKEQLFVKAVDGITLDIYQGETLGLVGESGCGKSTLGRCVLDLYTPTAGKVYYYGVTLDDYAPEYVRKIIQKIPSIGKADVQGILQKHHDAAAVAGGLLLSDDLNAVSDVFMKRFKTVGRLYQARVDVELYHFMLGAMAQDEITDKQKKHLQNLEATIVGIQKDSEAEIAQIAALREKAQDKPGYEELEKVHSVGVDLSKLTKEEMRKLRRYLQIVFQDPYSSLNPRLTVGNLISEALVAHKVFPKKAASVEKYTIKVMEDCGLQKYMLHRYSHQFSGGQRQRIGIARALALKPQFVVCDEAVSALDVSIQSQIINLLVDMKEQNHLTYLFISHDLSTVKFISDRVGVMYLGNMIELGKSNDIYAEPLHPYTEALLEAIPTTEEASNKELQILEGDIPSPIRPPSGCKFHTRCRYATDKCKEERPEWKELLPEHFVACHYPLLGKKRG
jgi:oligopeptide/dipeptide ABC transporter, ATP-binding protein, C-terminal domain